MCCPSCHEYARKYLEAVLIIKKLEIIGVCDKCLVKKKSGHSCKRCEAILKISLRDQKENIKQYEIRPDVSRVFRKIRNSLKFMHDEEERRKDDRIKKSCHSKSNLHLDTILETSRDALRGAQSQRDRKIQFRPMSVPQKYQTCRDTDVEFKYINLNKLSKEVESFIEVVNPDSGKIKTDEKIPNEVASIKKDQVPEVCKYLFPSKMDNTFLEQISSSHFTKDTPENINVNDLGLQMKQVYQLIKITLKIQSEEEPRLVKQQEKLKKQIANEQNLQKKQTLYKLLPLRIEEATKIINARERDLNILVLKIDNLRKQKEKILNEQLVNEKDPLRNQEIQNKIKKLDESKLVKTLKDQYTSEKKPLKRQKILKTLSKLIENLQEQEEKCVIDPIKGQDKDRNKRRVTQEKVQQISTSENRNSTHKYASNKDLLNIHKTKEENQIIEKQPVMQEEKILGDQHPTDNNLLKKPESKRELKKSDKYLFISISTSENRNLTHENASNKDLLNIHKTKEEHQIIETQPVMQDEKILRDQHLTDNNQLKKPEFKREPKESDKNSFVSISTSETRNLTHKYASNKDSLNIHKTKEEHQIIEKQPVMQEEKILRDQHPTDDNLLKKPESKREPKKSDKNSFVPKQETTLKETRETDPKRLKRQGKQKKIQSLKEKSLEQEEKLLKDQYETKTNTRKRQETQRENQTWIVSLSVGSDDSYSEGLDTTERKIVQRCDETLPEEKCTEDLGQANKGLSSKLVEGREKAVKEKTDKNKTAFTKTDNKCILRPEDIANLVHQLKEKQQKRETEYEALLMARKQDNLKTQTADGNALLATKAENEAERTENNQKEEEQVTNMRQVRSKLTLAMERESSEEKQLKREQALKILLAQESEELPLSTPPPLSPPPSSFITDIIQNEVETKEVSIYSEDLERDCLEGNKVKKTRSKIIFGAQVCLKKDVPSEKSMEETEEIMPRLFKSKFNRPLSPLVLSIDNTLEERSKWVQATDGIQHYKLSDPTYVKKGLTLPPMQKVVRKVKATEKATDGVLHYKLSDPTYVKKGWTILPVEKVLRKVNVYRMRPAHPEFDWFERNKNKKQLFYDSGEKLAEFDDNGRGHWYYRNGQLALDYYDSEELNAQQRFVIYSSGDRDDRGRSHPITVLGSFDFLGNGVVFDHGGKIRLKYNQMEGVVLDQTVGPVSKWKWHNLNDPPVMEQVIIDTQLTEKDPCIPNSSPSLHLRDRPDEKHMLAIEYEHYVKEKKKKFSPKYKPFQIKMKALKLNEHFSLRMLSQATVYLLFKDGTTKLKINVGMVLDDEEIVNTETFEVGDVEHMHAGMDTKCRGEGDEGGE